jgi:hypothetical protein
MFVFLSSKAHIWCSAVGDYRGGRKKRAEGASAESSAHEVGCTGGGAHLPEKRAREKSRELKEGRPVSSYRLRRQGLQDKDEGKGAHMSVG